MSEIRARLDARQLVRADFVQTRTMADLQRPLVARGKLMVWAPAGVIWRIEQPFRTAYVLRDESTIEIAADGARSVRQARDDRGTARVGRILRALLKGDTKALDEWFDTDARASAERWSITLSPKPGAMAFFFKSLQLSGGDFVDRVLIEEENGDSTQMLFRNQRDGDSPTDEERRLLTE